MAELTPLYMDIANVYSGDELGLPLRHIMGEGILGAADLAVTAGAGNSVDIAAGGCYVKGDTNVTRQPTYFCPNDATVNKGIAPDPANPRRVLVIAQAIDEAFAGVGRKWELQVIHGAPAAVPVLPATPASAIPLANVLVPAGAANSGAYTITDLRARAIVGGGDALLGAEQTLEVLWDSVDAGVALPAATVTTPALAQTYRDLLVVMLVRSDAGAGSLRIRLNGDTGANYDTGYTEGSGGTMSGAAVNGQVNGFAAGCAASTDPANVFGGGTLEIFDYRNATRKQLMIGFGARSHESGSGAKQRVSSTSWRTLAAVSTLTFFADAGSLVAGSRITVYGRG